MTIPDLKYLASRVPRIGMVEAASSCTSGKRCGETNGRRSRAVWVDCSSNQYTPLEWSWAPTVVYQFPGKAHRPRTDLENPPHYGLLSSMRICRGRQGKALPLTQPDRSTVPRWYLKIYNTRTHPFNGPLSGTTRVSRCQKGKTNLDFTEARDNEWQWYQLGHMQVCTSLQTDNHTSTPPLSFLQARCPFCHPTNSVKALM